MNAYPRKLARTLGIGVLTCLAAALSPAFAQHSGGGGHSSGGGASHNSGGAGARANYGVAERRSYGGHGIFYGHALDNGPHGCFGLGGYCGHGFYGSTYWHGGIYGL
jgi:hypothetical protein